MFRSNQIDLSHFYVAGINYRNTEASIRGQFAVNNLQYENIIAGAGPLGLNNFFILSTCNRTEIYGFAANQNELIAVLCTETSGAENDFKKIAYIKSGAEAVEHLFHVGSGLDSQILGDYEIISQLRLAVAFAESRNCVSPFLKRLINTVIKNSKDVKNQTALSKGTISVSFAAIKCIRESFEETRGLKILVLGTGKIGNLTCKNLVDYLPSSRITIMNRDIEKAAALATQLNLTCRPLSELHDAIRESDVILVATGAPEPIVLKQHFKQSDKKLVIDLSIPYNVDRSAKEIEGITLINVDELSKWQDETIQQRMNEIPRVREITAGNMHEFFTWAADSTRLAVLKTIKSKLQEIHSLPGFSRPAAGHAKNFTEPSIQIQRIINGTAIKMRHPGHQGCIYISAIHDFVTSPAATR